MVYQLKKESMLVNYVIEPTVQELADHFKAGLDYIYKNKEYCKAQSLMMYAWNEHDEGGWLYLINTYLIITW